MLCVRSDDVIWALALGEIAYRLQGDCPFAYGDTVRFGTAMTKESEMDAFVANYPFLIEPEDIHIELSNRIIHITQVYPIYQSEVDLIHSKGVDWLFGNKDFDLFDLQRQPVQA